MNTKTPYDAVIVVEGTSDMALLSSFLDCDIVITNGSDVPRETIDYLKTLSSTRQIVVLTDPDSPGKRIRDILDENIPGLYHAYIPKEKCIKHHKVGIAESSKDDILEALSHLQPPVSKERGNLTYADLFELGLVGAHNSSYLREELGKKLHLGQCNAKTILKRLNALNLSKENIRETIYG